MNLFEMQPSWICFARVSFAGALIPFLPGCRVILVVWGFMFNRLDFSHVRVAQKCEGVRETTPVSSFGGPEIPETAGESSGAQAQSGGGTPLVSALGELPPGRGGVGSLGRDRVVGKAEEPGASSRSVCTGSGQNHCRW